MVKAGPMVINSSLLFSLIGEGGASISIFSVIRSSKILGARLKNERTFSFLTVGTLLESVFIGISLPETEISP